MIKLKPSERCRNENVPFTSRKMLRPFTLGLTFKYFDEGKFSVNLL